MSKINTEKWIGLFLIFMGMQLGAEPTEHPNRIWAANTENRVEGTFYREVMGDILIKDTNGKNQLIRFEQLSKADRTYIGHCILPEIEIDVDFDSREIPRTEYTRPDDKTFIYTFDATIKKKSKLPYGDKLSAELFVIAREETVRDDSRFVLMSYNQQQFPLPEERGSERELTFPDILFMTYKADWALMGGSEQVDRGKTFLGTILAVSSPSGDLIDIETDIRIKWLVDDLPHTIEMLRKLYQEHPGHCESRHFNQKFKKLEPPRIKWFLRHPEKG